ncbi:MAG: hypothetical protein PHG00_17795 [Methylococcales bacterium]|nr:hypothetical protein [Methylococcales bacterium]
MAIERGQQQVIAGFESGGLQFSSGLAHGTFSDGTLGASGEGFKQLIQERLEAAFPGTQQKSHKDRKGEHAPAGKVLKIRAVGGDKVRVVQGSGNTRQDVGMDIARVDFMIFHGN